MRRCAIAGFLFFALACAAIAVMAQQRQSAAQSAAPVSTSCATADATYVADKIPSENATPPANKEAAAMERTLRIEGEKRFRQNCGRCHMAPHKFPPRVMATAIRHMRVRATLTDEDMRFILHYMTQ